MASTWHAICGEEAVRALARVAIERYGVWVGVLTPDGVPIPMAGAGASPPLAWCRAVMANGLAAPGAAGITRCSGSVRRWALEPEPGAERSCHAGLRALIVEIPGSQARVYASGFVEPGEAARAREALAARLPPLDGERRPITELGATERAALGAILEALGALIARGEAVRGGARESRGEEFEGMIGQSAPMRALYQLIDRIAPSDSTVLICGENGTGKELVARAIHRRSRRSEAPYVTLNCAAVPGELMESELFGHKRGAFSGAIRDRPGMFAAADGGTLLLDEIGELGVDLQAKLLRVLQHKSFLPVGAEVLSSVDARIVCATNRDLIEMVRRGEFREDLYYRINVIALRVPPLRERPSDIAALAERFLERAVREHDLGAKSIDADALARLAAHDWPGNVRELENEIGRAAILSGADAALTPSHFSERLAPPRTARAYLQGAPPPEGVTMPAAVDALERAMIGRALERCRGNKTKAAAALGVSRRNLIRKVARYESEAGGD